MKNKNKGFTLVEVIVSVVLIMAVMFYLIRTIIVTSDKNSELVIRQEYSVYENNLLSSFHNEVDKKITKDKIITGIQPDSNNPNILHFLDLGDDLEIKPGTGNDTDKIIFNNVVYSLPNNTNLVQKNGKYYSVSYVDSIYDLSSMIIVDIFTNVAGKDDIIKLTYQGLTSSNNTQACNITFHWNNASDTTQENTVQKSVRYEDVFDISSADVGNYTNGAFVKEEGWYTSATGGTLVDFSKPITECNMDVYAHWGGEGFDIVYDKNCSSGTGTMSKQKVAMNASGGTNPTQLNSNLFKCPGHEFHGWNTKADGTGVSYIDDGYIKSKTTGLTASELQEIKNAGGELKLYAQWDVNTVNKTYIKINMNKGYLVADKHGAEISTSGDYITKNGSTIIHQIEYNKEMGSPGMSNYNNTSFINIARTGYKVADTKQTYYFEKDGIKKYVDQDNGEYKADYFCDSSSSTCTQVIYVNWTPITYSVEYVKNKPSNASHNVAGTMSNSTHTYDKAKKLNKSTYTLTGWKWVSWNAAAAGTSTKRTNEESVKNLTSTDGATVKLYSQWQANQYTVKYNCGSGTGSIADGTHTYDTAKALKSYKGCSKTGYKFVNWKNGSNTYADKATVKNLTATAGGSVTLTAQWEPKTFKVTFDCNGGSGAPSTQKPTYDSKFSLTSKLCTTAKTGYHQVGWIRVSNNKTWTAASIKDYVWKINADVELKAKWEPNIYTVKYNCGSGTGTMSSSKFTYDATYTLSTNKCTRSGGYVFYRWKDPTGHYWKNGYSSTWKYVTPQYGITSSNELTLTATWLKYDSCVNSNCDINYEYAVIYLPSGVYSCSSSISAGGYTWSTFDPGYNSSGSQKSCSSAYTSGKRYTIGTSSTNVHMCCAYRKNGYKSCQHSTCGYVKNSDNTTRIYD